MNFKVENSRSKINTATGGLLSIACVMIAVMYLIQSYATLQKMENSNFTISDYKIDVDKIRSKTMDDFDKSFNYMLGI